MIFIEGGWRTPEEFVRDVYEAVVVNCPNQADRQRIFEMLHAKFYQPKDGA